LLNDYAVQLLDLMLEVSHVQFQLVYALGVFVSHPWILHLQLFKVEGFSSFSDLPFAFHLLSQGSDAITAERRNPGLV
jgi:hypothetical protein